MVHSRKPDQRPAGVARARGLRISARTAHGGCSRRLGANRSRRLGAPTARARLGAPAAHARLHLAVSHIPWVPLAAAASPYWWEREGFAPHGANATIFRPLLSLLREAFIVAARYAAFVRSVSRGQILGGLTFGAGGRDALGY